MRIIRNMPSKALCLALLAVWICPAWTTHHDEMVAEAAGEALLQLQDEIKSEAASQLGQDAEQENAYIGSDILLPSAEVGNIILNSLRSRRKRTLYNFDNFPENKWPNTNIFYTYQYEFSDAEKTIIRNSLQEWSSRTCLSFEERGSNDPILANTPHLGFQTGTDCISFTSMGENNMPQSIFLRASCFNVPGVVTHLIGHAVGLWHEHQRPDRDEYVTFQEENVQPEEAGNFFPLPEQIVNTYGQEYDYGSVMHFSSMRYTANSQPTLVPKDPLYLLTIGQRSEPSFWDVKKLNAAYCSERCPSQLTCENSGYVNPRDCSRCICPDSYGGTLCNQLAPSVGSALCGGTYTVGEDPVYISTPYYGGSGRYPINQECSWKVTGPEGSTIRVSFVEDFEIFCRRKVAFHWLEVRYEEDLIKTGPRFCGTSRPTNELESHSNEVRVVFKSNYDNENPNDAGTPIGHRIGAKLKFELVRDEVDVCAGVVCLNGGTCRPLGTAAYMCNCVEGYAGMNCATMVDPCSVGNLCHNGGTCVSSGSGYTCNCPQGYGGTDCSEVMNCGGCTVPPGNYQTACESPTETETVWATCTRYVTRQTRTGWFWWSSTITRTVCEYYRCQQEQPIRYCCEGAEMFYSSISTTPLCYATGWGEWGSCSSTCGGCGNQRRYQHSVITYTMGSGSRQSRTRCVGEEIRDCGFEPCTSCGTWYRPGRGRGGRYYYDCVCEIPCCDGYQLNAAGDMCVDGDAIPTTTPIAEADVPDRTPAPPVEADIPVYRTPPPPVNTPILPYYTTQIFDP